MRRRKPAKADKTGRSTVQSDPQQGPAIWQGHWTSLGRDLLDSHAWRAQSINCRRVIDRILLEHIGHGGLTNGALAVTHADFGRHGIRGNSVLPAIEEAIALGLIRREREGHRAWGAFKGRAAMFGLTWFGTVDGRPPSNEWKRFGSREEAEQAAKNARQRVEESASSRPARRNRVNPVPNAA
ncbi:hypothetical protein M446_3874 [Methylobacterium sp. 4-46]|uniref:hypothetical protein n=1 Tax=unclassified Methylobacterium TaxID=2615210 RepID=UPI000152D700|nr:MULTISPECIES: hypothetical protein [Methylobacterium]ACA18247.1 hypothetical protein M446_3874 [Methylobacterium sp. 4-46]WFT77542.1 hypothetical protein QA634_19665 [Methylobacterium nodulans]